MKTERRRAILLPVATNGLDSLLARLPEGEERWVVRSLVWLFVARRLVLVIAAAALSLRAF